MSKWNKGSWPTDFDPAAHPIIARHFFGIEPLHSIGQNAAEVMADLRFRRRVERLHRLGPRVTAELLAEIGVERSIMTVIDRKLATYVSIEPAAIEAAGGTRFWPAPLREAKP